MRETASTRASSKYAFCCALIILCGGPPVAYAQTDGNNAGCPGTVDVNFVASGVSLSARNNIHLILTKPDRQPWNGSAHLRVSEIDPLVIQNQVVDMRSGEGDIAYTVGGNNKGLGHLVARFDGWPPICPAFDQAIDLGFREHVRLAWDLDGENLQAGQRPIFTVHLHNANGGDVSFNVPLLVALRTTLGRLGYPADGESKADWRGEQTVNIPAGSSKTDPIYLRLDTGDSGTGKMYMSVAMSAKSDKLQDAEFAIKARLDPTRLFCWILIGAVLWWLISTVLEQLKTQWDTKRALKALVASAVIALLALLIGPAGLGLKGPIDQTTASGGVVFGLMSAAVGLDGVLKKLMP